MEGTCLTHGGHVSCAKIVVGKDVKKYHFKDLGFNLLATDFFFQILAHPVFKM